MELWGAFFVSPRSFFSVGVFAAHKAAEKNSKENWWDYSFNMHSLDWI